MRIFLILLLFLPSVCDANVGVFTGNGHDIQLITSSKIQMVSEEITITPGRGKFLFDGSVEGMDLVDYRCQFELLNHSAEAAKVQVGFPLDAEFLQQPAADGPSGTELIMHYRFIAQEDGHVYSLRHVANDKEGKLSNIFLWEMTFTPQERKKLWVSYSMPMSTSIGSMRRDLVGEERAKAYPKKWYKALEQSWGQRFGYLTETGKSWQGTIDRATFRVHIAGFEEYLRQRGMFEESKLRREERQARKKSGKKAVLLLKHPTMFRSVEPSGWKAVDGYLEWKHVNYTAGTPITFRYDLLYLPRTRSDTVLLVDRLFGDSPDPSDIEDLESIVRAYYGEPIENARVKSFLNNQSWYLRKSKGTPPAEVLKQLARYRNS